MEAEVKTHLRSDFEVLLAISFPRAEKSEHTHLPRPECPDLSGAGGEHRLRVGGWPWPTAAAAAPCV